MSWQIMGQFSPPLWVGQRATFFEKKEYVPVMFKQISRAFVSPCRALRNYTLLGTQFGVRLEIMSVSASVWQ